MEDKEIRSLVGARPQGWRNGLVHTPSWALLGERFHVLYYKESRHQRLTGEEQESYLLTISIATSSRSDSSAPIP